MAYIRSIKPEFFCDEKIGSLSPLARLAYQWLWTESDHAGRARLTPARLRAGALMFDDLSLEQAEAIQQELVDQGRVVPYCHEGEHYVFLPRLVKHARPDRSKIRPAGLWYPAPPVELAQRYPDYVEGCAWLCEGKEGEALAPVVCPPPSAPVGPAVVEAISHDGPTMDEPISHEGRTFAPRSPNVRPTFAGGSSLDLDLDLDQDLSPPKAPPVTGEGAESEKPAEEKPAAPRVPFTRMLELAVQHAPSLKHYPRAEMTSGDERHFRAAWNAGGEQGWVELMQRAERCGLCRGERGDKGAWGPGLVAKHRVKLLRGDYDDSPTRGRLSADERRLERRRAELAAMNRENSAPSAKSAPLPLAAQLCQQAEAVLAAELDPPRELVKALGGPEAWQRVLGMRQHPRFLGELYALCERAAEGRAA